MTHASARRFTVVVAAIVICLVVACGFVLTHSAALTAWDSGILRDISNFRWPPITAGSLAIDTYFSGVRAALIVTGVAIAMLVVTRRLRMPLTFLALVVVPWLGNETIKAIVRRPRPDEALLSHHLLATPTSFSYPSGHTSFAAALCLALLLTVGQRRWRPLFIVIAIVVPLATAFSRMYLGVHYLTDVVAGLIYTAAAVAIVFIAIRRLFGPASERPRRTVQSERQRGTL